MGNYTPFTERVISIVSAIPLGRVATYGGIARASGNPLAARQVARILHSCSERFALPWHRVINSSGRISLPGDGGALQRALLAQEGVLFGPDDRIDLLECGIHK